MTHTIDLDGLLKRLHLPTVRRLYPELCRRAESEEMSYRDLLALLVSEEVAHRSQTRIERAVRKARFPFLATIEEFSFTFQTSLRLSMLGSYLGPELVSEGRCVVLLGPTGLGKTHLAIAIAYRAIQNGYDALFTLVPGVNYFTDTATVAHEHGGRVEGGAEPLPHSAPVRLCPPPPHGGENRGIGFAAHCASVVSAAARLRRLAASPR
jgi:hypothetical protein